MVKIYNVGEFGTYGSLSVFHMYCYSNSPFILVLHFHCTLLGGSRIITGGLSGNWHAMRDTIQLVLLENF